MNDTAEEKMPFTAHLEELRRRLTICAISVGAGFIICYIFSKQLFNLLVAPLVHALPQGSKLIYTALPEAFFTYLKVAFVAGLLLSTPMIFYQMWKFIAPGLYANEKKYVIPFVVSSSALFIGGALFGYLVVFPFGFQFFLGYTTDTIQALPSLKQYFSFSIKLLIAFGLVFELPIITFFLAKMGVVTAAMMRKQRKIAIVVIFVAAAIFTPPDVITQLMMAVPLLVLYEISIIIAKVFGKKKEEAEEEDEDEQEEESAQVDKG